ncbi:MAG TPA: type II secretion system protein [Thiobacillaceae bacterium]|nr:type II secretion system protein [Thiobacillaceae bacterium]
MKSQHGFTLIELAIVLIVVTILIGGLAGPLSAQIQARRVTETQKTLEEARDAIVGYAMTHRTTAGRPYLPCPDTNGDGREDRDGTGACLLSQGFFPWVDLGSARHDAWGNRLRYVVESDLAHRSLGFSSVTTLPDPPTSGWKQIASAHGCATVDVAAATPFVLISHGANGWGALNVSGATLAAPASADELENLGADDGCYVSRAPGKAGEAAGEFDDLLTWLSFGVLVSRVCPAPAGCP